MKPSFLSFDGEDYSSDFVAGALPMQSKSKSEVIYLKKKLDGVAQLVADCPRAYSTTDKYTHPVIDIGDPLVNLISSCMDKIRNINNNVVFAVVPTLILVLSNYIV